MKLDYFIIIITNPNSNICDVYKNLKNRFFAFKNSQIKVNLKCQFTKQYDLLHIAVQYAECNFNEYNYIGALSIITPQTILIYCNPLLELIRMYEK